MPYDQRQALLDIMMAERAKRRGQKRKPLTLDEQQKLAMQQRQQQLEDEFNARARMRVPEMPE